MSVTEIYLHEWSIHLGAKVLHGKERAPNVFINNVLIHILQLLPCINSSSCESHSN